MGKSGSNMGSCSTSFFNMRRTHNSDKRVVRESWSVLRRFLAYVVESKVFEVTMGLVMVAYAILVLLETDHRASPSGRVPHWLYITMLVMLCIYVVDVFVRLYVYRRKFFKNSWNIFDLTIIGIDVSTEILALFELQIGASVAVLRILRLARLMRFMHVVSFFQELYLMLRLMVSAMRAIGWGALLMVLMLTMWSVVAVEVINPLNRKIAEETDAYAECDRCSRAFESVLQSNLTFFQQIIAGDSWGETSIVLIEAYPWVSVLLVSVMMSINLGLMNLVITVIVERAHAARDENVQRQLEEKQKEFERARSNFLTLCETLDEDRSGTITLAELEAGFDNVPEFADTLKLMDLKREDMHVLFTCLDTDNSGAVSYDEFAEELHRMKMMDTHMVGIFTKAYVQQLCQMVKSQSREVDRLHENMRSRFDELHVMMHEVRQISKISLPPPDVSAAPGASDTSAPMMVREIQPSGSFDIVEERSSNASVCMPASLWRDSLLLQMTEVRVPRTVRNLPPDAAAMSNTFCSGQCPQVRLQQLHLEQQQQPQAHLSAAAAAAAAVAAASAERVGRAGEQRSFYALQVASERT